MKRVVGSMIGLLVLALGTTNARSQAVIEGSVDLPKPPAGFFTPPRYQGESAAVGAPEAPTAVVYLEGSFPATSATNAPVQLWQKNMQFYPALLPIQLGTVVEFPNADEFYHNVFSYSKAKRFDLGRYRKEDKAASQTFEKPGVVKIYCEIHDHMRATVLVLETPYFTRTSTNGTFRLDKLPPGNYTLKAWLDENTVREKKVELEAGKTNHVDFPAK